MITLRKIINFSWIVSFIKIVTYSILIILGVTYFCFAAIKDENKRVQSYLKILNYDVGAVDGVIGAKTIKALKSALEEDIDVKEVKVNVSLVNSKLTQLYLKKMFERSKTIPHLQEKMDISDARHLLERAGIGAPPEEVAKLINMSRGEAVYKILSELNLCKVTTKPIAYGKDITPYLVQNGFEPSSRAFKTRRTIEISDLRSWWIREMILTKCPQKERLTLFWTNHFSIEYSAIERQAVMIYNKHFMLRGHGFGNFKALVKNIIKDPAMIKYLDNEWSTKDAPNENLARELMELFVLGEGKYSEKDVKEAARALTGFTFNRRVGLKFQINDWARDKGRKTLFGQSGYYNGFNLVDILFNQPSASTFLTRKFWKYYVSNTNINEEEILKISTSFKESNFEIPILLNEILSSKSFWDDDYRGTIIKSPVDLVIGTIRSTGINYLNENIIAYDLKSLGQNIFEPPNVAGWLGGEAWITPSRYLSRVEFLKFFTSPGFIRKSGVMGSMSMNSMSNKNLNNENKDRKRSKKYSNFFPYFYNKNPVRKDQLLISHVNVEWANSFNQKRQWRNISINLYGVRFNDHTQDYLRLDLTHDRRENHVYLIIQEKYCSRKCLNDQFPPVAKKNKNQLNIYLEKNESNWGRDHFYGLSANDKKFVAALWQAFPNIWNEIKQTQAYIRSDISKPLKSWEKKVSQIKKELRQSRYAKDYSLKKVKISNDFIYEMMKFDEVTEEETRELKRRSDNFLLLSNYNKDFSGFKSLSDKLLGGNLMEELLLSTPPLSNVSAHNLSRDDINAGSLRFLTEEVYNRGVGHISLYDNQGNFNGLVSLYDSAENLEKDLYLRQKYYDVPDSDLTLSNVSETTSNIGLTGMAISKSFSDNSKEETNFAIISMWKPGEKISLQKLINDPVYQVK